jgi:hypothetical protein
MMGFGSCGAKKPVALAFASDPNGHGWAVTEKESSMAQPLMPAYGGAATTSYNTIAVPAATGIAADPAAMTGTPLE